jgi:hypothetical protein
VSRMVFACTAVYYGLLRSAASASLWQAACSKHAHAARDSLRRAEMRVDTLDTASSPRLAEPEEPALKRCSSPAWSPPPSPAPS